MGDVIQPMILNATELPALPEEWRFMTTEEATTQLKPGKLFDNKTAKKTGAVPILSQGAEGYVGFHDESPGVVASRLEPVVTFANHTCEMRLMMRPFSVIQNIFPKVGKPGVVDTRYFFYAAQGRVRITDYKGHHPLFRQCYIPVPPIQSQRRIASILSTYDDLIENNTRRIAILEEMARRIYEEWFVRFRFPGHEQVKMLESELGLIPEGWRILTVADFGKVITGKTPSKSDPENFGNDVPFIKTPDMHGNMFCTSTGEGLSAKGTESQKGKTLPPNSLCVSCIGTAGIVSITTRPAQTNQQINAVVLNDLRNREFLYFALVGLRETINLYGANGATMVNLNKSKFGGLKIVYGDRSTLDHYHTVASPMFEEIRVLQLKNANLRTTRDLLLPKLISGELDVSTLPEHEEPIAA